MTKMVEVPFVPKDGKTEYQVKVEVDEGRIVDIIEVNKMVAGEQVSENPKKFKRKLGKSDIRLLEETIRYSSP